MSLYQAKSYADYWLRKVDEYSLHSPFAFDIYQDIFKGSVDPERFSEIEYIREKMEQDPRIIEPISLGSPSELTRGKNQRINQIAKHGVTRRRHSELLYRICLQAKAESIIELGTSLGINTLYLSMLPKARVRTFEGNPELAAIANENFKALRKENIQLIEGDLDEILKHQIDLVAKVDFAFIDANHKYEPTLNYFNLLSRKTYDDSVIAIDDIHRSREMEAAWNEILSSPLVRVSFDIYQMGIIYFNTELTKQHYILSF